MIDRDNVISIHEAGHSIVARALALHCGGATMADGCGRADYEDDEAEHGSIATIIAHMAGAPPRGFCLAASPTASHRIQRVPKNWA